MTKTELLTKEEFINGLEYPFLVAIVLSMDDLPNFYEEYPELADAIARVLEGKNRKNDDAFYVRDFLLANLANVDLGSLK